MSEQPPDPNQQLNISDNVSVESSQIGGQAGRDMSVAQNQGSGNIFQGNTFNIFSNQKDVVKTEPTQQEYKNRHILLNKVRNFWIKNVLETSLHDRVLVEMELEERLDAVNHAQGIVREVSNQARQTLPSGTRVIDKFNEMGIGRTLLILGEPGSGKTTTLLELARYLIYSADDDDNQPIPVVFNLFSWGREKVYQNITDWVVQELNRGYLVPKKLGRNWIKEQKLLLLLDGLDEVKEEICRNSFVAALNQFCQEYRQTEIIITSSISGYERLSCRLGLQSAIYLKLPPSQTVYPTKSFQKQFSWWKWSLIYVIAVTIAIIIAVQLNILNLNSEDILIYSLAYGVDFVTVECPFIIITYISLFLIFTPLSFTLKQQTTSLASPIAALINSLYLLPSFLIILCSHLPVISLVLPAKTWLIITIFSFYISLRRIKNIYIRKNINVFSWVKSWAGWSLSKRLEPATGEEFKSLIKKSSLPLLTICISIIDIFARFGRLSVTVNAPIVQLFLVAGSFGTTIYKLTATGKEFHPLLGEKKVLKFTKLARLTSVIASIIAMIIWVVLASQEIQGDLQIATAKIPNAVERTMSVTLVNRGRTVRILKEFHVESKTSLSFMCLSGDFEVPLVGEYQLPFHIGSPLTVIKAEPEKQFKPETPGRVELVLKPNSIGKCAHNWKAMVRVLVVSDDSKRSGTDWFKLTSNK